MKMNHMVHLLVQSIPQCLKMLAQNMYISAATINQLGAIAAFDCYDELDAHIPRYEENRDLLYRGLPAEFLGNHAPSDGAFYLYADLHSLSPSLESETFCAQLLKEAKVAATPGMDFDKERGARYVRFSYARSSDEIDRAVNRLNEFLARFQ